MARNINTENQEDRKDQKKEADIGDISRNIMISTQAFWVIASSIL
jgi:hypothetical protein